MADESMDRELERIVRAIREGHRIHPENLGDMDSDVTASIIGAAFHQLGYKTRLKMVRQAGQRHFHHVFVEVYNPISGEWMPVDPQRPGPDDWEEERTKKV